LMTRGSRHTAKRTGACKRRMPPALLPCQSQPFDFLQLSAGRRIEHFRPRALDDGPFVTDVHDSWPWNASISRPRSRQRGGADSHFASLPSLLCVNSNFFCKPRPIPIQRISRIRCPFWRRRTVDALEVVLHMARFVCESPAHGPCMAGGSLHASCTIHSTSQRPRGHGHQFALACFL
jgi:hypothetical protein